MTHSGKRTRYRVNNCGSPAIATVTASVHPDCKVYPRRPNIANKEVLAVVTIERFFPTALTGTIQLDLARWESEKWPTVIDGSAQK